MAGFCVELRFRRSAPIMPMRLVSLGAGEVQGTFAAGGTRALWSRWPESRQLWVHREPERLFWIEGQPDRWPARGESVAHWLDGRWGSFRGFEVDGVAGRVTVFADPFGSRPVFTLRTPHALLVADKLVTLAAMAPEVVRLDHDAIVEQVATGCVLSDHTSLEGARQIPAGVTIVFDATGERLSRRALPPVAGLEPERIAADPAGTLLDALRTAVAETWTSPDAALLLSGGLDSRLVLRLAGSGRRTLTVTTQENRESRIARRVAAACAAEFTHILRPAEQYLRVCEDADLLTGMLDHPTHAHFLGMLSAWRTAGVPAIAHAYLFDTFLKGYYVTPLDAGHTEPGLPVPHGAAPLTVPAHLRDVMFDGRDATSLLAALSREGCERLRRRLATLTAIIPSRPVDGFETAVEHRLLGNITRNGSYGNLYSWIEEQDVHSVILHPAIWAWLHGSRPRHRRHGRAFRGALRRAGLDLMLLPDGNTGLPALLPRHLLELRAAARRTRWYPAARRVWHTLRPCAQARWSEPLTDERSWPPLAPVFRAAEGKRLVEQALGELASLPQFDSAALEGLLDDYLAGDDRLSTTVIALAGTGRWVGRIRQLRRGAAGPWLRTAAPEPQPLAEVCA